MSEVQSLRPTFNATLSIPGARGWEPIRTHEIDAFKQKCFLHLQNRKQLEFQGSNGFGTNELDIECVHDPLGNEYQFNEKGYFQVAGWLVPKSDESMPTKVRIVFPNKGNVFMVTFFHRGCGLDLRNPVPLVGHDKQNP